MGHGARHGLTAARSWALRLVCATLLSLAVAAVAARPASAVTAGQILQVINQERAANGIPPLSLSAQLSAGNANHDNYERLNGSPSTGYDIRGEDPSKPGYTPSGAQAGLNSLLAFGTRSSSDIFNNDDWAFGDVFDNAPNHLVELMDPAVETIGADQLDFNQPPYGTIHISSVDVRSAPLRPNPSTVQLYSYIGSDGRAPSSVTYVEGPTANQVSGPWLYVYFLKPAGVKLALQSIALEEPDGTPVPAITSASGAFTSAPGGAADVRAVGGSGTPTSGVDPKGGLGPPSKTSADRAKQDEKANKQSEFDDMWPDEDFLCASLENEGDLEELCDAALEIAEDVALAQIDPPDPAFTQVALPASTAAAPTERCSRWPKRLRRVCPSLRPREIAYAEALARIAATQQAQYVALNRLSTAASVGNQAGVELQEAVLSTLEGENASEVAVQARTGAALAKALRRAGLHGQVSAKKLRTIARGLLSGNPRRFPRGLLSSLHRRGIPPARFSSVLRQAHPPQPKTMNLLSALTTTPSAAPMNAIYDRLGPSGVGAIVASLASTGAISSSEESRLDAYVADAEAATTAAERQAAMNGFLAALDPLATGQLRTFLETAAVGLTGSDGYSLVVDYTVNGRAQTARIPVPLAGS